MRVYFCFFMFLTLELGGCGQAYFPIELKTISRSERLERQASLDVNIIAMNSASILSANNQPYVRRVVEAGNLSKPAKLLLAKNALKSVYPAENDPGPYFVGVGDTIKFTKIMKSNLNPIAQRVERLLYVKENGLINFYEFGTIDVEGLSESQMEDLVYKKLTSAGETFDFQIEMCREGNTYSF